MIKNLVFFVSKHVGLMAERRQLALISLLYCCGFICSLKFSYDIRFDFSVPHEYSHAIFYTLLWLVPLKLLALWRMGQINTMWGYFRLPDVFRVAFALALTSLLTLIIANYTDRTLTPSRGIILLDYLFSFFSVTALRTILRVFYEQYQTSGETTRKRTAIIGAGDIGSRIAADLLYKRGLGLKPVVFLDDDSEKIGCTIHGLYVAGGIDALELASMRYRLDAVVIALPEKYREKIRPIVECATKLGLTTRVVSEVYDGLLTPKLQNVELEHLLNRQPVTLDRNAVAELIRDRVVLVTGAGGSIGSELVRQIASLSPLKLVLVDHSEFLLFEIEQEINAMGLSGELIACVGDIKNTSKMDQILQTYRPNVVFHAAAYKHVYLMERQPAEAIRNNTIGTLAFAQLVQKHKIPKFIFISTDKAINPTSVMGASKRVAEKALQALQLESPDTRFISVRFGNVLGSSGSVIPIFKKQIAAGGPITVTHPDITRYFMTIPEAAGLVLQSSAMGKGGEIFVLDMGNPVKIADVAKKMIELSGLIPEVDIQIKYIGLRPGEKLFEELQHTMESCTITAHPRIWLLKISSSCWGDWRISVDELLNHADNTLEIKKIIKKIVPEYTPYTEPSI